MNEDTKHKTDQFVDKLLESQRTELIDEIRESQIVSLILLLFIGLSSVYLFIPIWDYKQLLFFYIAFGVIYLIYSYLREKERQKIMSMILEKKLPFLNNERGIETIVRLNTFVFVFICFGLYIGNNQSMPGLYFYILILISYLVQSEIKQEFKVIIQNDYINIIRNNILNGVNSKNESTKKFYNERIESENYSFWSFKSCIDFRNAIIEQDNQNVFDPHLRAN
ncbi:MAG: hypothetical protein QM482_05470 [Sulfurospirillum sp.]